MRIEQAESGSNLNNLRVLLALPVLAAYCWWWGSFSGPFRWLIDLELKLFGRYWEPSAGIALGLAVFGVCLLIATLPKRMLPRLSASAENAVVLTGFTVASVFGLMKAWERWDHAAHMPSRSDPVQVVDLDRIGDGAPPTGHVRLIGVPDRGRQVLIHTYGRRGSSYWDGYAPLTGRQTRDPASPVRILVTRRGDEGEAAQSVQDDPEGLLLADGLDMRTIYTVRQRGMRLVDHPFVLFWTGSDPRFDVYVEACLLALPILLLWPFAVYRSIKERRERKLAPAFVAAPIRMAVPEPVPTTAVPSDGPPETTRSRLTSRAGMALLIVAGGVGWWAPFTHDFVSMMAWYAVAGALFVVGMLIFAFGPRAAVAPVAPQRPMAPGPSMEALRPLPNAALLCVMREQRVSSTSYFRLDVDGVPVGDFNANQYTVVALAPGAHTVAINHRVSLTGDTVERFDAVAGEVVVFQLDVPFTGSPRLERIVDLDAARATLTRLTPVSPSV